MVGVGLMGLGRDYRVTLPSLALYPAPFPLPFPNLSKPIDSSLPFVPFLPLTTTPGIHPSIVFPMLGQVLGWLNRGKGMMGRMDGVGDWEGMGWYKRG